MTVSPDKPFQIIYSLFEHEYLGFIFESFVVQLNDNGNLTFSNQNISSSNAYEFASGLDHSDYELINWMDGLQQDVVINHFYRKRIKPDQFFLKVFDKEKGDESLQKEILQYMDRRRAKICPLLKDKMLFEMGKDGEPTWKRLAISEHKATVLFHFYKNEDNTHYFPTIKLAGEKVEFYKNGSYLPCLEPAWMIANGILFTFEKNVNGKKLQPFLKKKFVEVPSKVEETYFQKFVAPLVASFDVHAKGFNIETKIFSPAPLLTFSELVNGPSTSLFNEKTRDHHEEKILFELKFAYDRYEFSADRLDPVSVSVERQNSHFTFKKVVRDPDQEKAIISHLTGIGLPLRNSRTTLEKTLAFSWLNEHQSDLINRGFQIRQHANGDKRYFIGEANIEMNIQENIDWFDIKSKIYFGPFEIPFAKIRQYILAKKYEIQLPDGTFAVIPATWVSEYADLFAFSNQNGQEVRLHKMHLSLVKELKDNHKAAVDISAKLELLSNFKEISEYPLPKSFEGALRSYQLAGFNWLKFLNDYGFGGCLADDMGLGKTVQTLALLVSEKEEQGAYTNLLVMPTSLVYNWQMEARKFTPSLRILNYTGPGRIKNPTLFSRYDVVITSYGTTRVDADLLKTFYFNYIILDESQAIKNPDSRIAIEIKKLRSRRKLILTGTPIENSTMDLWSQMSFVNPGLLGTKAFFKKTYQIPIEKKKDATKTQRLNALIKPFMLRREKSQVTRDLPEKVENIRYCQLSEAQREYYESEKNAFRNKIFDLIHDRGINESHLVLIQGLTRLRQIANHPKLVNPDYTDDSGKFEDITYMIKNALIEDHKLLIFSQFVKHLQLVADHLKKNEIPFAYLDGSTRDRQKQVENFQSDNHINTFLISLKAGGLGLNLTRADYVFLLDPWWNPAAEAQAIDRAHRIGQTQRVFTYKFIARDTVEEKILKLQQTKLMLVQDIITIEESFVKNLTDSDIKKLFE